MGCSRVSSMRGDSKFAFDEIYAMIKQLPK